MHTYLPFCLLDIVYFSGHHLKLFKINYITRGGGGAGVLYMFWGGGVFIIFKVKEFF